MTLHWPLAGEVMQFSLVAFSSVFFTVDPIASIPAFLAMGANSSADRKQQIAKRAAWTCFLVLTVFASTGSLIFKLFGITLPAFQIAGGILLFQIALEMVYSRRSATQEVAEERERAKGKTTLALLHCESGKRCSTS